MALATPIKATTLPELLEACTPNDGGGQARGTGKRVSAAPVDDFGVGGSRTSRHEGGFLVPLMLGARLHFAVGAKGGAFFPPLFFGTAIGNWTGFRRLEVCVLLFLATALGSWAGFKSGAVAVAPDLAAELVPAGPVWHMA